MVTVYDLSFVRYPQSFNTANRLYLNWAVRHSLQSADRVIAISESTKRDLVAFFGAALAPTLLAWGLQRRQFSFVAYAAVYGYVGVSAVLIRDMHDDTAVLSYFVFTGVAMLVMLVQIARRFGREG